MNRKLLRLLCLATLLMPVLAGAVTEEDFEAETTQSLLNLCTVSADDPRHKEAIHFCHGYLVGAYDYHIAERSGAGLQPMVCLPTPHPSRNEAISLFVAWAKAHPQYMGERPVEAEFRFLIETWPCKS
jgi:Rap1a immunity proteins